MQRPPALLILLAVCLSGFAATDTGQSFALTLTRGSRLMIDARINGRPVRALLDSAAEATLIDRGFAQTLKLHGGPEVSGQGSGQASFGAALVNGVRLEALGLSLPDQTVAVTDLTDVARRLLGHRIDFILGREIFDAARLTIDIDGRRIAVVPRDSVPRGVRLELVTEHGVETVPVRVESGAPVRATFDLGNGSRILIAAALAARMGLLTDGRRVATDQGGGLGREATRQFIVLRSLEVAGRSFADVPASIDPQSSASDVNIGVAILRHFWITIDFANHAGSMPLRGAAHRAAKAEAGENCPWTHSAGALEVPPAGAPPPPPPPQAHSSTVVGAQVSSNAVLLIKKRDGRHPCRENARFQMLHGCPTRCRTVRGPASYCTIRKSFAPQLNSWLYSYMAVSLLNRWPTGELR